MKELKHPSRQKTNHKRVLMVVENSPYPQDIRVRSEALTLISAGYKLSVIAPASKGQPSREIVEGVHVYRYPAPPPGDSLWGYVVEYGYSLVSIFYLALLVNFSRGFDIMHTANPPDTTVLVGGFFKLFGKRFIFDHHDLSPEMYGMRFRGKNNSVVLKLLLLFERLSCRLSDHIITTNQSLKEIDTGRNKVPEERVTVVRNGPSLDMLQHVEPDMSLRPNGRINIVYVGAISVQDGVDYLIRALHHLAVDLGRNNFHCYVVGAGVALKEIQAMSAEIGLENCITYTGWVLQDEVKRYISSADICVDPDPSNEYNDRCTMIKMMEYMTFGKPIVAFDLPEHRITAGKAALYARPNDELDFARKIADLMDDPECCEEMGRSGRERIENKLAWSWQAERLLGAYESIT